MADRAKRKPRPAMNPEPPAFVPVNRTLLEVVRATYPVARDWTDAQVTAGCLAMAIKQPRTRTVHSG